MKQSATQQFRRWWSKTALLGRAPDNCVGSAIVELALVLSIFGVPLLLGTIEAAVLLFNYSEVANAAHVGAAYGMRSSTFAHDSTGIAAAAQAEAYTLGAALTVTPLIYYACSAALDGTRYSSATAATAACTGGSNHSLQFIQVTASASVTPPMHLPGHPASLTMQGLSVMEVQE